MSATDDSEGVQIAAIDNGLAFPFKHPDQWRTCEWLPVARYNIILYPFHSGCVFQIHSTGRGYPWLKSHSQMK